MAETPAALVEAIAVAREQDTFAAFAKLESSGTPAEVAALYSKSVFVLYGEKDVPLTVAFGRRGIAFALEAARADGLPEESATDLRATAKTIAYNVAANTWPGWDDEGIEISQTDLALGLDCARLNLRLAVELDKPADKVSAAHWLLGAQQMANGDTEAAIASFHTAARFSEKAEQPRETLLNESYAALAGMLVERTRATSLSQFDATVTAPRNEGSDDAKFYADQLETARKVFVKDMP